MKKNFQLFLLLSAGSLFGMLLISIFLHSTYTHLAYRYARAQEQCAQLKKQRQKLKIKLEQEKTAHSITLKAEKRGMKPLRVTSLKEN